VLEVRDLRKRYGRQVAVDGVSFRVERGQRYGLLGPNGAGKTTTISVITGTVDADQGGVELDGDAINTRAVRSKRRIGYVPQELALYDDLHARDNLRFFGAMYGLFGAESERRSDYALEVAGLADRAREPVKQFSGGMKRRLNIAIALLHQPELLVLDEPTVGVDPQSRNAIFETLLSLSNEGMTLLYTTHYMEEVERLCHRIAIMDHGQILAEDSLDGLRRRLPRTNVVRVETEGPVEMHGLAGSWDGEFFETEIGDLARDLSPMLGQLSAAGAKVVGVRTQAPTLEDVFLDLTGRALRD